MAVIELGYSLRAVRSLQISQLAAPMLCAGKTARRCRSRLPDGTWKRQPAWPRWPRSRPAAGTYRPNLAARGILPRRISSSKWDGLPVRPGRTWKSILRDFLSRRGNIKASCARSGPRRSPMPEDPVRDNFQGGGRPRVRLSFLVSPCLRTGPRPLQCPRSEDGVNPDCAPPGCSPQCVRH